MQIIWTEKYIYNYFCQTTKVCLCSFTNTLILNTIHVFSFPAITQALINHRVPDRLTLCCPTTTKWNILNWVHKTCSLSLYYTEKHNTHAGLLYSDGDLYCSPLEDYLCINIHMLNNMHVLACQHHHTYMNIIIHKQWQFHITDSMIFCIPIL